MRLIEFIIESNRRLRKMETSHLNIISGFFAQWKKWYAKIQVLTKTKKKHLKNEKLTKNSGWDTTIWTHACGFSSGEAILEEKTFFNEFETYFLTCFHDNIWTIFTGYLTTFPVGRGMFNIDDRLFPLIAVEFVFRSQTMPFQLETMLWSSFCLHCFFHRRAFVINFEKPFPKRYQSHARRLCTQPKQTLN